MRIFGSPALAKIKMIFKKILIFISLISFLIFSACNRFDSSSNNEITAISQEIGTDSEDETEFKTLDKIQILKKLYDNPVIDSLGNALWVPNYSESMELPISFDNKCHTNIDTILHFMDSRDNNCAAVIFTHHRYLQSKEDSSYIVISGSHFEGVPLGIALFKQGRNGIWKIYKFSKYFSRLGYFGTYRTGRDNAGEISIKLIGDKWNCLSLKQGIGGSAGVIWGYESLYSIEEFQIRKNTNDFEPKEWFNDHLLQNVLTYNYYASYSSGDEENIYLKVAELQFVEKEKDYFDLVLNIFQNGKKYSERYCYDENVYKYVRIIE